MHIRVECVCEVEIEKRERDFHMLITSDTAKVGAE